MNLNLPVAYLFDLPGAEQLFSMPEGVDLKDVYGEGWSTAFINAEADPAWLTAIIVFLKAHWVAIVVSGLILGALVGFFKIIVDVIPNPDYIKWIVIGLGLLFGYRLLKKEKAPSQVIVAGKGDT